MLAHLLEPRRRSSHVCLAPLACCMPLKRDVSPSGTTTSSHQKQKHLQTPEEWWHRHMQLTATCASYLPSPEANSCSLRQPEPPSSLSSLLATHLTNDTYACSAVPGAYPVNILRQEITLRSPGPHTQTVFAEVPPLGSRRKTWRTARTIARLLP